MTDWTGNPGNHRDPYGRGWWHRHWLLSDGEYIKTSEQTRCVVRWSDPAPRNFQALQEVINDVVTAMNLSVGLQAPISASDIRQLGIDS